MFLRNEGGMLRRVPMFSKIETAKLKPLAFASDHNYDPSGAALCHQGDQGDSAC